MSFEHENDATPSNAMSDVILQLQLTSASTFKTVTLWFDITCFLALAI